MNERFEADFSRQYRLAINGAVPLGLAVAAGASYLSGLSLIAGAIWTLVITLALLSQRWILLGVSYNVAHDRLTVTRGPYRTHVPWSSVVRMRRGQHRQHGVGGFVIERRDGDEVTVAPRQHGRFIRAVALRAPQVRFAWEERGGRRSFSSSAGGAASATGG
jgi:hypothetical protein